MNIFVLDESPVTSAQMMNDKHVVKMPTESMQMMSTILTYHEQPAPFLPVMLNHPCTIWARESRQNFQWLREHAQALCEEFTVRYNKQHKVEWILDHFADTWVKMENEILPDNGLTPFAIAISDHMNCRQIDGYDEMSAVYKYRQYYIHDKAHIADWKTSKPEWYGDE